MSSVNTPEEQAIAFLLICVENSQKGKVRETELLQTCDLGPVKRSLFCSTNISSSKFGITI